MREKITPRNAEVALSEHEVAQLMKKDWQDLPANLRDQLMTEVITTDELRARVWICRMPIPANRQFTFCQ